MAETEVKKINGRTLSDDHAREEIKSLKESIEKLPSSGDGLTLLVKQALMNVVEHIGLWTDGNGKNYVDDLRNALYTSPLTSLSAVYNQSKTVYVTDSLDVLRDDLTVMGTFEDGSSALVTNYTLSGVLTVGTSTIIVSSGGVSTTINVTVTQSRVPATGITLNNTTLQIAGKTPVQLTALVTPTNSTDNVVWRSSENAVATVENGLVTPVASGSCTIYATAGEHTAECSVNVTLSLNGINIGNPYLNYVSSDPTTLGKSDDELKDKWYNGFYNTWSNNLGMSGVLFLHPFTDGTYYIRTLYRSNSPYFDFYAFENGDIVSNPTKTLGKVGNTYTEASVEKFFTFDCELNANDSYGRPNIGEWTYVDDSGSFTEGFVMLFKLTVPKDVYVFWTQNGYLQASQFPGISDRYPLNDWYTIFEEDPSGNITQIVE